jgi:short-chain Z-isoprenyl diphosphate synthase
VVQWCVYLGINTLSVYAFSTDNFSRSSEEVDELFRLMVLASAKLKAKE